MAEPASTEVVEAVLVVALAPVTIVAPAVLVVVFMHIPLAAEALEELSKVAQELPEQRAQVLMVEREEAEALEIPPELAALEVLAEQMVEALEAVVEELLSEAPEELAEWAQFMLLLGEMKAYMCKKCGLLYGCKKPDMCSCSGELIPCGHVIGDAELDIKASMDAFKEEEAKKG